MISIVIPVYNGEKTIKDLYRKIKYELNGLYYFEVIFVNDCGKDRSWGIITELARDESESVRGYCLDKNYGQHYATSFGLKKAKGDYIFTIDEDAQHDPKFIPAMIKKMEDENFDLVYGQFYKLEQSFLRVRMSSFLRKVLCVMIPELPQDYSGYRLINKELAVKIIEKEEFCFFLDAELGSLSMKHGSLLIDHNKRSNGNSSYTIHKLLKQTIDVLFKYSKLFKWIFNSFLLLIIFLLLAFTYRLLIYSSFQDMIFSIILLISFLGFIFIKRNSFERIHRKLNIKVVEQTHHNK
jgi:polyisoprenyl-phosphate glycosyltransferase